MCFSAEADVVAAVVVGVAAIDAWRHVDRPSQRPLAALPAVLAVHQLVEAFVWWGLEGDVPRWLWRPSMWLYLLIAFAVVPVLVPLAVAVLEPVASRGRMAVAALVGVVVAVVLTHALVRGPVEARVEGHRIAYEVDVWTGGMIVVVYVVATCGALLASRRPAIRWFGGANLVAVALLAWLDQSALVSLWCAWAAVTSILVAVHLRGVQRAGPLVAVGHVV